MRIAVAPFGILALASAQSSGSSNEVTTTFAAVPVSTSLTAQQRCLQACDKSDICCQAACVNVPCPNEVAVNQTTSCAAQCVQGNGTEEETAWYAACQSSCISSNFFSLSTTTGDAAATDSSAFANATTTTGSSTGTGIGESSASATDIAASATDSSDSGNGAARNTVAGAGLLGLIVVGLSL